MMMRISGGMVQSVRGNFKERYRKKNLPITCQSCKASNDNNAPVDDTEKPMDTQTHLLEECVAFDDIRNEFDLQTETGLVGFFKEVIKRRNEDENDNPSL